MTIEAKRLHAIYGQVPELEGLDYTIAKVQMVVPKRRLIAGRSDGPEMEERLLYTFYTEKDGEDRFEIKVTIDGQGKILKFITSK